MGLRNFILFLILISFSGCKKKWKEPVRVDFDIECKGVDAGGQSGPNSLSINSGTLYISKIRITGKRKQSSDVDFSAETAVAVNAANNTSDHPVYFDIPQGTYTDFNLEITTGDANKSFIKIQGFFTGEIPIPPRPQQPPVFPVIIEIATPSAYQVKAKENNGSNEIVLVKPNGRRAAIVFDIEYWFANVPMEMWEDAELQNIQGKPTIIVNNLYNTTIYSKISDQINFSITTTFK